MNSHHEKFISLSHLNLGMTESTRLEHNPLGEVEVTVSSSSLNADANLTSGGLFQSSSEKSQWLRLDLLEPHFIVYFTVVTAGGMCHI